ncbi:MAG: Nif3-like dinuclear metal center hexameric protein [Bacteroidota bacterium]
MPTIHEVTAHLETIAPSSYQESYDNAGLITGHPGWEAKGAILSLDATEDVVAEAIQLGANMVIAHHPIVFRGLKKINGKNYVERAVISAIKHDIAIYAIHTNLDNVYHQGVNTKIAQVLGLENTRILAPKKLMKKMRAYVPTAGMGNLLTELPKAGATNVNYSSENQVMIDQDEYFRESKKLEISFPSGRQGTITHLIKKYAPEAYIEVQEMEGRSSQVGSGMIGELPEAMPELDFLTNLKTTMKTGCVRHTRLLDKPVRKIAVCGGAGSFLLPHALRQKADVFVTADYKYHEFFDADGQIIIADIGHFESEQFTVELLGEIISKKFPTFALHFSKMTTNPVYYL